MRRIFCCAYYDGFTVADLYAKAKTLGLWFGATSDQTLRTVQWWDCY